MKKYKNGDIVTGCVTGIEKYGIFLSIDEKHSGLIHISEISSAYVRNIYDFVKIGEIIQAKVIEDEQNSNQIKLSIKNINYKLNDRLNSKINETALGFFTLKNKLNSWIEEKNEELLNKNEKN